MNLVDFNVWLDTIFVALYVFVIAFLGWHFFMFVKTGRYRKSFIEGKWPEHDWRPPTTPKALHFVHMMSMIFLGVTGMYLRFPFFYGGRTFMRGTHYFFMVVVIAILVWRIWYAFRSKTNADWREFAIGKVDLGSMLGVVKFYGYLSNDKPHVAKYNVMQKMCYQLFLYMMLAQAFTGLAILRFELPFINQTPSFLLVGWWLGPMVGGAAMALWYVRMVHYVLNWGFIIMSTVHLYLALTVDVPCALDFFGLRELQIDPNAHGHAPAPDHDDGSIDRMPPGRELLPEPAM